MGVCTRICVAGGGSGGGMGAKSFAMHKKTAPAACHLGLV